MQSNVNILKATIIITQRTPTSNDNAHWEVIFVEKKNPGAPGQLFL